MDPHAYLQHCRELITTVGLMIQGVSPAGPDHRAFWYYTVGLTPLGHPEFTLSGVTPDIAQALLNDMGTRVRDGQAFKEGDELDDVIGGGYKVHLIDARAFTRFPLAVVKTIYPDHEPRALQIVLPDAHHRFPWQPGYSMDLQEVMFG